MRFYPVLCKVINDIALLAEPFIEVIITVIPVAGTFDSSPDLRPVRKFKCDLRGVSAGIEVDKIGKLLSPEITRVERASTKRIESMMLLFPEPFGPDITVKPSKKGIFVFLEKDLKLSISSSVICKDPAPYFFAGSFLSSSAA